MKNYFRSALLVVATGSTISLNAQTLFTYGTKSVSKQEFLKAYNKNNTGNQVTEKLLRDYLELYIPFKLKVQAAYDMKLDTLPAQKAELQAFRNQVMQSYLTDASSVKDLVNEAFERSQQDIRISHIFIPFEGDAAGTEVRAEQKAQEAYNQLQQGKPFADVAVAFSGDPGVKVNRGDLGYITVFSLPYELENLAYSTPLNSFSKPFKSKAGYHIFKRTGERKAVGKIRVAQILLAFPPDATPAIRKQIADRADSIYNALVKGADFAKLAMDYSNDNFSYQQGGEVAEFGTGRYDAPFELAAFALQKDNDISKPVLTEYGYHIIKRLSAKPVVTDRNDHEYIESLDAQVQADARMEVSKKAFLNNVLRNIGYKKGNFNADQLWAYTDSTLTNKPVPAKTTINPAVVLFSFSRQDITVRDWLAFRRSVGGVERISGGKTQQELLDYYTELAALEYYRNHLEEFNADFAFQVNEFKDGNLLFEVMQRKVWDKASTDSSGLKKFYSTRKDKYWWENSASAVLFTALHDSTARDLRNKIEANGITNWRSVVEAYEGSVIADSGRFELTQLPIAANSGITPGKLTSGIRNESDSSVTFAYVIKLFPQRESRSFDDAKGYVINDYQLHLENAWIAELRKKYPVKVNEAVFSTLTK
ncbi:MAG TPA: peptidylprolyl isomerase [Chitinophagaceae bacterium]|nr:peptidylprolyl isomerase [Chitinophagaceae bacterium]